MFLVGIDDPPDYGMADDIHLGEVLECDAFHALQRMFGLAEA